MRSSTPPWPGIRLELSFTGRGALQHRLEQVADDAEADDRQAEQCAGRRRHARQPPRAQHHHQQRAADEAADGAFDRLLRADDGSEQPAAEQPARVVLRGVACDNREHDEDRGLATVGPADGREPAERKPEVERREHGGGRGSDAGRDQGRRQQQRRPRRSRWRPRAPARAACRATPRSPSRPASVPRQAAAESGRRAPRTASPARRMRGRRRAPPARRALRAAQAN